MEFDTPQDEGHPASESGSHLMPGISSRLP